MMSHYHIRWSGKEGLDWESFGSHAEAEESAKQLVRRGETYTIEEHDEACLRCQTAFELKTDHAPAANATQTPEYPWQQAVLAAFTETRPEYLPLKMNAAQRAISARLTDPTPADLDERLGLRDALQSLRVLLPEPAQPKNESAQKKAIA